MPRPITSTPRKANAHARQAGYTRGKDGIRFHLTIKTSTDETSRTLAVVMQQQLRDVGIALDVRSFEFATFYADIAKGAFQMYTLRWIGGNEDPDIFRYAYATASWPPHGANRGYYSNPTVDALIAKASSTPGQSDRAAIYRQIQQILADRPSVDQSLVSRHGDRSQPAAAEHQALQLREFRLPSRRDVACRSGWRGIARIMMECERTETHGIQRWRPGRRL